MKEALGLNSGQLSSINRQVGSGGGQLPASTEMKMKDKVAETMDAHLNPKQSTVVAVMLPAKGLEEAGQIFENAGGLTQAGNIENIANPGNILGGLSPFGMTTGAIGQSKNAAPPSKGVVGVGIGDGNAAPGSHGGEAVVSGGNNGQWFAHDSGHTSSPTTGRGAGVSRDAGHEI